jgi:hypothetical protein
MTIHRVLLACMPKSGSSFVSTAIAQLPGFVRAHLLPGYGCREQELCIDKLREYEALGLPYIAQHHVRYSEITGEYMARFGLRPVVLVRNIFDVIPSLVDHHSLENSVYPAAFAPDDIASRCFEEQARFVTDMAIPWYFNFFVSWARVNGKLLVTYEEFIADPEKVLARICSHLGVSASEQQIREAVRIAGGASPRKNKVVPGRGRDLPTDCIQAIQRMAAYYHDIDFSPLGIERA